MVGMSKTLTDDESFSQWPAKKPTDLQCWASSSGAVPGKPGKNGTRLLTRFYRKCQGKIVGLSTSQPDSR
jgi:hypothetical protein